MGDSKQARILWIVVGVQSGVPVLVEAFRDEKSAKRKRQAFRKSMRPDYDEAGVFEIEV